MVIRTLVRRAVDLRNGVRGVHEDLTEARIICFDRRDGPDVLRDRRATPPRVAGQAERELPHARCRCRSRESTRACTAFSPIWAIEEVVAIARGAPTGCSRELIDMLLESRQGPERLSAIAAWTPSAPRALRDIPRIPRHRRARFASARGGHVDVERARARSTHAALDWSLTLRDAASRGVTPKQKTMRGPLCGVPRRPFLIVKGRSS
jgi:hypothetical protein